MPHTKVRHICWLGLFLCAWGEFKHGRLLSFVGWLLDSALYAKQQQGADACRPRQLPDSLMSAAASQPDNT
jgi:hypothetical protein